MSHPRENRSDLEIEAPRRQRANVLLVGAARVGSTGLRTVIAESGDLRLIAQVSQGAYAVSAAEQWKPDHILVAADGVSETLATLLHQLRSASPDSTVVVCTDQFGDEALRTLVQLNVQGILAWADVTPEVLCRTLELVAQGLHVQSPGVAQAMLAASEQPSRALRESVALTDRQQAVLQAMGSLDRQKDVAASLQIGERTLHDRIATLKRKLDANTQFMLGAWAHALGLVQLKAPRS